MNKRFTVVCPDCGHEMQYHPRKSYEEMKGSRRKECILCGRSFKVKDQVKAKVGQSKKDRSDKPKGFFKYSKSDDD